MDVKNIFTLLKILSFRYVVVIFLFMVVNPSSFVQAQNPDEEGEIFWDDEEEYEAEEDEFEDEEYLDDEDYYEDDEEFEDEYEDDEEEYEEDDQFEDIEESVNQVDRSGWNVDISGAAARLVNYTLWKEYGLNESAWEPSIQGKVRRENSCLWPLWLWKINTH